DDGVFLSNDKGKNWQSIGLVSKRILMLATHGSVIFASTYDGIFFSHKVNEWIDANDSLPQGTRVYTSYIDRDTIYIGTDNGIWRRPLSDFGINSVGINKSSEQNLSNFPNPFSQSTSIKFSTSGHSFTQVSIHNLLGSE